ncbi:hypothetical protein FRC12_008595 [Ceratobasidium sp. 428]|nr:hypothetical protein FRC12_008595 [Ceratobasidium sp. 428]
MSEIAIPMMISSSSPWVATAFRVASNEEAVTATSDCGASCVDSATTLPPPNDSTWVPYLVPEDVFLLSGDICLKPDANVTVQVLPKTEAGDWVSDT